MPCFFREGKQVKDMCQGNGEGKKGCLGTSKKRVVAPSSTFPADEGGQVKWNDELAGWRSLKIGKSQIQRCAPTKFEVGGGESVWGGTFDGGGKRSKSEIKCKLSRRKKEKGPDQV